MSRPILLLLLSLDVFFPAKKNPPRLKFNLSIKRKSRRRMSKRLRRRKRKHTIGTRYMTTNTAQELLEIMNTKYTAERGQRFHQRFDQHQRKIWRWNSNRQQPRYPCRGSRMGSVWRAQRKRPTRPLL